MLNTRTRLSLAVLGLVLLAAPAAFAQTLEEVIAGNLETRGGLEALKGVESARVTGKMNIPGGGELPFTMEYKRPKKFRMEMEMQGMTMVQAFDGETGWQIMPFMGNPDPTPMSADDMKNMEEQADFIEGPFIDSEDKGYKLELVGKEEIEGTEAYKIKVINKHGDEAYHYLDTDYFLEFKLEGKREIQGTETKFTTTIGDYKEVGNVILAHSIESMPEGAPAGMAVTIEKYDLNVEIDDGHFIMPEKEEEPADEAGE